MSSSPQTNQLSSIYKAGFALLLLLVFLFGMSQTLQAANDGVTAVVEQRSVGLHSGAEWGYHVVGKVFENQTVEVVACNPDLDWVYVRSGSEAGWMATDTLSLSGSMDSLPIWTAPLDGAKLKPVATIRQATLGIHSGSDWGYHVVGEAERGQEVILMAVSADNEWYFIWSDAGDGWVPASGLGLSAGLDLPIWTNSMNNAVIKPTATINRAKLGIHSGAAHGYHVTGTVFQNDEFILQGRNAEGTWVFIWSDAGDGWVPVSSLSTDYNIMMLAVWNLEMDNAILKPTARITGQTVSMHSGAGFNFNTIGTLNKGETPILMATDATGDWVFIWSDTGDGWVPVLALASNLDLASLPTWPTVIKGGHGVANGMVDWQFANLRSDSVNGAYQYNRLQAGQRVTLMARDGSGDWLYVASPYGDGWIATNSISTRTNTTLLGIR